MEPDRIAPANDDAVRFILQEYAFFTEFFARTGITPQIITSEQVFDDPAATLGQISDRLGHDLPDHIAIGQPGKSRPNQPSLRAGLTRHADQAPFGGFFTAKRPRT